MRLILVMVMSANGKTTNGDSPSIYTWTSPEDRAYFFSLIQDNDVIIMGRKTYEAAKPVMKLQPGKLRIVMTNQPAVYENQTVPGQLKFTKDSPTQIVNSLASDNYEQALLVGGSQINHQFLKDKLVSELWLTIEPHLFSSGNPLIAEEFATSLELQSIEQLNDRGTLLLKYTVL